MKPIPIPNGLLTLVKESHGFVVFEYAGEVRVKTHVFPYATTQRKAEQCMRELGRELNREPVKESK